MQRAPGMLDAVTVTIALKADPLRDFTGLAANAPGCEAAASPKWHPQRGVGGPT